ncbi:MAG: ECF transporter S component [Erysipelotrichaceae bacterium]|nr:ECF transporter S component [Erysipelotrichaceae bacterium]
MTMKSVDSSKGRLRSTYIAIMIPLGVAINYIGGQLASSLSLPIYMDSIGTAIVAAIMGPWVGAASGVLFNIISALVGGNIMASLFGICNIGTGLIVGYMARMGKFKKLWPDVVIASILVAVWNAATGAPIAMAVYGGIDGNAGTNIMIAAMQNMGRDLFSSAFLARIPTNLLDKGIACVVAWLILSKLPENMQNLNGKKA